MNLPATTLLKLWETGAAHPPSARPAALLAASAREPLEEILRLPLGRRDARLLEWYCELAGSRFEALTDCPECQSPVELEFEAADVERAAGPDGPVTAKGDGWELSWRAPDTRDFCLAARAGTAAEARQILSDCCLIVTRGEANQPPPAHLLSRLMELAAEADPQADVQLALNCPACGADWQAPFDIGFFLWTRIEAEALRLLADVHELAAVCSWSEAEILSLSPARRSAYLQLTRSA
ncbi:hypothetical protein HQ447_15295 [bacterium]|nr:hypothetical protein [bacterium]